YLIDLQYGEIKWTVKRNVVDFYDLWVTLKFRSTIESPPSFPSKVQNFAHAIASLRSAHEQNSIMIHSELTSLDTRNEKRRLELAQYLQELVEKSQKVEDLTGLTDLCEFLEVSGISIVKDMGWKGKEGYLEQKVVTRSAPVLRPIRRYGWVKKWFILRDSYIAFCKDTSSTTPTDVMLLDKEFKYHTSERKQFSSHSVITLAKGSKSIQIRVQKGVDEWLDNLNTVKLKSPWVSQQRFNSFAPIRENAKVKWFVDGHEYFEAVAEAILSAKSDIFIEDWWLYLRRPPKGNEDYRIDRLLKRKASLDDVKIYIVIYKSMKVALPLNSGHTKHWLQDAHPNIIVQRHSNITEAPFWAHHEKILVIDHRLAFVGGLDLCFGRYDTSDHDLTDYAADGEMFPEIFPGQDYSNPRIQDFVNVRKYALETVDKRRIARMPWHDIHTGMVGRPARDVARHFIERWNFIKTESHKDRDDIPYLLPKGEHIASSDESKFRGTCKYSIYKAYMECIQKAKHFIYIENQFFITTTVSKDKLIENNIGEAIVKRITRAHTEKEKFRVIIVIPAAPGFEGDFTVADKRSMALRNVAHYQYQSISRGGNSVLEKLRQANIPAEEYIGFCSLRNWGRIKTTTATPLSSGIKEESTPIVDSSTTNVGRLENNSVEFNDARMDYVTEQVYIHSKLMIVDDKTVICGSDSRMNGLPYKASRFALTLRMQLFKEHLGLLNSGEDKERQDAIVMDPLHDEFYYGVWTKTAKDNTEIYRTLFKCVPDDTGKELDGMITL
ncbi:hypothetical protein BDB00DRAFT_758785, partial [Zychaea mexicana]|uniref:uncharacterized protein n=1 Tax=Zychaea mexicana TaxID=64656 RepID=UPI0022FEFF0B